MKDTDQIAAEAAEKCAMAWINGGSVKYLQSIIQSAIEKAKRVDSEAVAKELDEHLATQGRAAHASEQGALNLNEIRDNALNMIFSGINHTLSADDEDYVKGQIDWVIKQVMWGCIRRAADASEPLNTDQIAAEIT